MTAWDAISPAGAMLLAPLVSAVGFAAFFYRGWQRERAERWQERRLAEELDAYLRLDSAPPEDPGDDPDAAQQAMRSWAQHICRRIASKSAFGRVALLVVEDNGRLTRCASIGMDDRSCAALDRWADAAAAARANEAGAARQESGNVLYMRTRSLESCGSFSIALGEWQEFDREVGMRAVSGKQERRRWRRGLVAPIRSRSSGLLGAIVVCAESTVRGSARERRGRPTPENAMAAIEALAVRLAQDLDGPVTAELPAGAGRRAAWPTRGEADVTPIRSPQPIEQTS